MELETKLEVLSAAAKFDVSCSSSGSNRKNTPGGLGNSHKSGICHSWSEDGRCISLLKVLFSNQCIYNCAYCVNRCGNDTQRASFTPEEVALLTLNFYRRNYIEGLFLSSGVVKNPDYTMELLLKTVRILRKEYHFNGYIHLKAIPGADFRLIHEAGLYVDRMSVNIELPTNEGLKLLAPNKDKDSILKPMNFIKNTIATLKEENKIFNNRQTFVPAGQSTQLIVGATPDHDLRILKLSENLYKQFNLKRVYYSAYVPVVEHPNLPVKSSPPPILREHRLYQADWLLRFYGFSSNELLDEDRPDFDLELDPKSSWAIRNLNQFPVEINKVDYHTLLRIPGIGVKSAQTIISSRKLCSLGYDDLKKIGVVLKRAKHFITCKGKFYGKAHNEISIKDELRSNKALNKAGYTEQISIFTYFNNVVYSGMQGNYR
ncbi:MAG: putative DNA modification/repair radical SAM protein [Bacillota bacterium]|nr:putative DNA modification/repair radical SAM protein [Bacillota bacterium]